MTVGLFSVVVLLHMSTARFWDAWFPISVVTFPQRGRQPTVHAVPSPSLFRRPILLNHRPTPRGTGRLRTNQKLSRPTVTLIPNFAPHFRPLEPDDQD
jgi:hypothetical protein